MLKGPEGEPEADDVSKGDGRPEGKDAEGEREDGEAGPDDGDPINDDLAEDYEEKPMGVEVRSGTVRGVGRLCASWNCE